MTLRPAVLADSQAVAALMTQLGYPAAPIEIERRLARLLAHPDYAAVVAETGGELAGLILLHLEQGLEYDSAYCRVMGLVIDERWRGRGLGRHLMDHAEQWCKDRGGDRVLLTSANRRDDAHKFYDAIGYERTGVRFAKWLR